MVHSGRTAMQGRAVKLTGLIQGQLVGGGRNKSAKESGRGRELFSLAPTNCSEDGNINYCASWAGYIWFTTLMAL